MPFQFLEEREECVEVFILIEKLRSSEVPSKFGCEIYYYSLGIAISFLPVWLVAGTVSLPLYGIKDMKYIRIHLALFNYALC